MSIGQLWLLSLCCRRKSFLMPRREAVPRKAKIGFLHETEAEPTARPQKTKIGFLHETEAEPTARQGPEHIGFSIQINHAIPHLIRRNN